MNLEDKCGQGIVTPLRRINEISGWWQGVEDDANSSDQMEEKGNYVWFKRILLLTIGLLGLLLLSPGTWLLARDLHGVGDPVKDVLQAYVPQS